MPGIGTLINVGTVFIGGSVGLILGEAISEELRNTVMRGLGIITLIIGFQMALDTNMIFIPMGSVVVGGMLGQWWGIKEKLDALGASLKHKFSAALPETEKTERFSTGFVTASLVFCVGPMTILGAIQDGLTGDFSLLAIKSGLDGFSAMAFASTMGVGVLFSILTLIIYQGGLTLVAALLSGQLVGIDVAGSAAVNELSATGGALIIGIGLLLLEIKDIQVSNYLPAIVIAPAVVGILTLLGITIG